MREIHTDAIIAAVRRMCIDSNLYLPEDVFGALEAGRAAEDWPKARTMLDKILENAQLARDENSPLCQDTGMACVFLELGQEVHIVGDSLYDAINEGVRRGYRDGFLRKSVVRDPLRRENTGDNTPAVINCEIVPGESLAITVAPKGFGSENMSRTKMLKPSDGEAGLREFVLESVLLAGPNPCPPIVVGVGVGGTFERVALLAKKALLRELSARNPDPYYAEMEESLLSDINKTGIGPQGFGGKTTALAVNILQFPTHIAGLPAAVNISCHVTRHVRAVL